jgi:hypothetical protein
LHRGDGLLVHDCSVNKVKINKAMILTDSCCLPEWVR